jgi:lipid-binding SYLF domain-containing protein
MKYLVTLIALFLLFPIYSQTGGWNPKLKEDADAALSNMIQNMPKLETFKNEAYAYVVFPKVTKAGIGIGGAAGKGIVYKSHAPVGSSKLKQASIGLQLGGQQYSEVIFFKDQEAFDKFTNGNLKFDAQASAVAITEGASADLSYSGGVAVFTQTKGGLMYEASIGGQHFTYTPFE